MKIKKEIAIPLFSGFYHSPFCQYDNWYDCEMDCLIDNGKTQKEAEKYLDEYDTRPANLAVSQDIADAFLKIWNDNFPQCQIALKFVELNSPREYNFSTDRIFCEIECDLAKLEELTLNSHFKKYVEENFTSRSGFHSFYSSDSESWREKPVSEWDEVQIASIFESACESEGLDGWSLYDACQDVISETFCNAVT